MMLMCFLQTIIKQAMFILKSYNISITISYLLMLILIQIKQESIYIYSKQGYKNSLPQRHPLEVEKWSTFFSNSS